MSALVPSSSQPKKQTHSWQLVLVISPTCEVGGRHFGCQKDQNCESAWNGPGMSLQGFSAHPRCPRAKLDA